MKRIAKYIMSLSVVMISIVACTDNFDELNTDTLNASDESLQQDFQIIGAFYSPIFQNIYQYRPEWSYQLQQNLNADIYSGYMTNPRPFVAGANNTTYALVDGWNNFPWDVAYTNVMNNAQKIEERGREDFPTLYAVSLILKVTAMHRVSDIFGPIVYTQFGESETTSSYDSQQEAYTAFFADLDLAVETLSQDLDSQRFVSFDLVYGGDYNKWVRFANSLRLRLATRIAMADPAKAQLEAEKALSNPIGLIESNEDNFVINGSQSHPLQTINSSWGDIRMNASMESILVGYDDPRIGNYFGESADYAGEYKGIRNGLPLLPGYPEELAQKADYIGFSELGGDVINTTQVQLMTAAEVYFLRAEAALRGWAGAGDARSNYESGISTSMSQYGISASAAYIADNTSVPIDYVDPVTAANNIAAASSITIAWNDGDTNETKLERIITQKWIAVYPDGQEAWSEFRRTGYPRIFPVVSNQSGGTVDTNIQIRRLPFTANEKAQNPDGVAGAITKLGGADNAGTRLWWDTNSNF
ncbi:RagB/SusD family nutrient uptake outer membrane protein [Aquimarina sp. 2201CG5-10]|uniref:RagB/SusD family nutrient uptake outer membrane protein n=1 Tax=Aquimarina callyspongiae TaxID=3098150 RepID=UPI002AB4F007|nr:RagB/SusD family nutrient uptake outer membrane protein [Aquimarina sp. 2201CG5-10]MDY8135138.1 RagB/SusD family nutrient uptake outer membrane protein [Aquimarina sp. 2201CG5-10]